MVAVFVGNNKKEYPLSTQVGNYQGKPFISVNKGKYSQLSGGVAKWQSLLSQDESGDSNLLEVVKFLHANSTDFNQIRLNVETFFNQYRVWEHDMNNTETL